MLSVWRRQEYQKLSELSLVGNVLDIGGSKKSGYHQLIKGNVDIVTANIDPSYDCDVLFDVEKKFPFADAFFNNVICLNVLEHLYDFKNVFIESERVLKPGGKFVIATPFMFPVHGSPNDYHRYTKSCFEKNLLAAGFKSFKIIELGYGPLSVFINMIGGSIRPKFLQSAIQYLVVGIEKTLLRFEKYKKLRDRTPLGYFVVAEKTG